MGQDEVNVSRQGSSLPVPNVQEIAASLGSAEIPQRYIRPDVDPVSVASADSVELPVLDLGQLLDPEAFQEESAKLKMACENWGFFQLVNHGIAEEMLDQLKADVTEFFKLPLEEKKAFAQLPGELEGYGQAFVTSEEQKLDWADMMYIITRSPHSRNMRFWPTHPPTFRDTLDEYSMAVKEVAESLLGLMARSLGQDPNVILGRFKDQSQTMRINYYPPCPKADNVIGLSPHSDGSGLTLLIQVSDTQGLQIKKDGKWLPIEVLPGALVANIGDMLEIMTNGIFRSIEHRAMINPKMERLSIAAFHSPNSGWVGPLSEFVQYGEKKYKSISLQEYRRAFFAAKLDGKSNLARMKLQE